MGIHSNLYNTKEWKKIRFRHLHYHPYCVVCMTVGRQTVATVADHITPHRGNKVLFYDVTNIQSLCKPCHDSYKQRLETQGYAKPVETIGIDGLPNSWR
jgi:5-methylcytosine-specific restriction endonuclease McrA